MSLRILQLVSGEGKNKHAICIQAEIVGAYLKSKDFDIVFRRSLAKECSIICVHYTPYGFGFKGLPFTLFVSVLFWKYLMRKRVIFFFHELYASYKEASRIYMAVFYLQKVYCALFSRLASKVLTSNSVMASMLANWTSKSVEVIPIFSNIDQGNKYAFIPFSERANVAVVFGAYGRRLAVYESIISMGIGMKQIGIDEIWDIGNGAIPESILKSGLKVVTMGFLSDDKLLEKLLASRFGFIHYAEKIFGKSTVFAAYAQAGLCVINFCDVMKGSADGVEKNNHFFNATDEDFLFSTTHDFAERIALNLHNLYEMRDAKSAAEKFENTFLT